MQFTYDIHRTWQQNCETGPTLKWNQGSPPCPTPARSAADEAPRKMFLGLPVSSRIGIAAGLLLNSRWIADYAALGFDILTYKTVRTVARPCYPLPNWVFVDDDCPQDPALPVYVRETAPVEVDKVTSAVCFGMPSVAPEIWRNDIRIARSHLRPGQILVVSVVATPGPAASPEELAEDFARGAAWAAEAGADVIEANLSCPNVCSAEGTIYHDVRLSELVTRRIREAIGTTPLLLKVGLFPDTQVQRDFLNRTAGLAQGVTLVNCVVRPVLHRDGRPAFGPEFVKAGVLGRAIHRPSVEAVGRACDLIRQDGLPLQVAAVGGISTVDDCRDFFDAGAAAVLCGSSPMYLPDLAVRIREEHPEW